MKIRDVPDGIYLVKIDNPNLNFFEGSFMYVSNLSSSVNTVKISNELSFTFGSVYIIHKRFCQDWEIRIIYEIK